MKPFTPALPILVFSALLLTACGQDNAGHAQSNSNNAAPDSLQSRGEVVAVVNGVNLTDQRVSVYLKGLPPLNEDSRGEIVDNMISSELLAQAARKDGLAEELREDMLVARQAVLVRADLNNYLAENPVSDEDIKARYDAFAAEFQGRQEYLVSHILLPDEDGAKAALAELQSNPERFADIAKERSQDPGSGANGGDLGWTSPEGLVPPFAEAMRQLSPGEMSSAPVQSQFGWHIIKVADTRSAAPPALEGRFRQQFESEARNEKVTQHIEQLRAAATVELKELN